MSREIRPGPTKARLAWLRLVDRYPTHRGPRSPVRYHCWQLGYTEWRVSLDGELMAWSEMVRRDVPGWRDRYLRRGEVLTELGRQLLREADGAQ